MNAAVQETAQMSKSVHRLRRLSDDLLDLEIAMDQAGHRGHNTYGRQMNYVGKTLLVAAKSFARDGIIVEFISGLPNDGVLLDRVAYVPVGVDEAHIMGGIRRPDVTMTALARAISNTEFERTPIGADRESVSAEEVDFVVGFFRDKRNNVLISRYSSKGIGEELGYVDIVPMEPHFPVPHLKEG